MADLTVLDLLLLIFTLLPSLTSAQFFNFHDMFGQQQQQQRQQPQNVASDSNWYQGTYNDVQCDKYLCPGTLSCVHFPHHCPCAFPFVEDKIEFGEGSMMCASKGGYKAGETFRKVELARKGLL